MGDRNRLHWMKISLPDGPLPDPDPDVDLRVLLPADEEFDPIAEKLTAHGAAVRRVRYLVEDEAISGDWPQRGRLVAWGLDCQLVRPVGRVPHRVTGKAASAAAEAFDLMWQAHASDPAAEVAISAAEVLPPDWLDFFPFQTLNPAQAEALPAVLEGNDNLIVVAPTGSGKTAIGMSAALTAIRRRRKAAWLVPQRSLTEELNRNLDRWRHKGVRVERLSGEHKLDVERIARADIWIATTEKFEVICRTSSLKEALADVAVLIVDEIHLLGDPSRGPVLEALLARMRGAAEPIRLIGLSGTVSNAEQIAEWLHARLLRSTYRPTRLTWQLPRIPSHSDWQVTEAARTRLAAAITEKVTADGGSVVVFCGSKRNARRTALVIAGYRGAPVHGVHPDDVHRLYEVCRSAGVGLHYTGWEYRNRTEEEFRARRLDVLVATSTLAAGVNLPARAVVIRDTQVGLDSFDVGTVQQMFGRAGRIGAGEREGWAFLIVEGQERPMWQARLVAGHTVRSQIETSLPDHVLGEVVQGRVTSLPEAERWWVQTLAYHQGSRSTVPLRRSIAFLVRAGYLERVTGTGDRFVATSLGQFTARLMVSTVVGYEIRRALAHLDVPEDADQAERRLIGVVSTLIPKLAQASTGDEARAAVSAFLATVDPDAGTRMKAGERVPPNQGDLARASLLAVSQTPQLFHPGVRSVAGIPYSAMYPILEETPRYLHWLGGQGLLGTVHPWCAVVAADLGRRVRWRHLRPPRGSGRLLWMCEQMATPVHMDEAVPELWAAARARGFVDPDWASLSRPTGCRLDDASYRALLRERATTCHLRLEANGRVHAVGPTGSVLTVWNGSRYRHFPIRGGAVTVTVDPWVKSEAAVFTWRGDYLATGWLSGYARVASEP